jgi:hypothetical protein
MLRDVEMHDPSTNMRQHDHHDQHATGEGRNVKKSIDAADAR